MRRGFRKKWKICWKTRENDGKKCLEKLFDNKRMWRPQRVASAADNADENAIFVFWVFSRLDCVCVHVN